MNGILENQMLEDAPSANPIILIGKERKTYNRSDLTGQRFGRLIVMSYAGIIGNGKNKATTWFCRCDCGKEKTIRGADLKSQRTRSCGCLQKERVTTHGMKGTPTYESWGQIKLRCNNPKNKRYEHYGGRGITVCKRWLKFEDFFEDMGKKPKGLTIERIDNNGNYEPSNCKWATPKEQNRNSRHNRIITYKDKTQCMAEWADEFNIKYDTLRKRLNKYPPEIAFNM